MVALFASTIFALPPDTFVQEPTPVAFIITEPPVRATQLSTSSFPACTGAFTVINTALLVSAHIGATVVVYILRK